jgi:hypothetical protein
MSLNSIIDSGLPYAAPKSAHLLLQVSQLCVPPNSLSGPPAADIEIKNASALSCRSPLRFAKEVALSRFTKPKEARKSNRRRGCFLSFRLALQLLLCMTFRLHRHVDQLCQRRWSQSARWHWSYMRRYNVFPLLFPSTTSLSFIPCEICWSVPRSLHVATRRSQGLYRRWN